MLEPFELYIIFPLPGGCGGEFGGKATTFDGGKQSFEFGGEGVHRRRVYKGW